jgi:phenylpropionate dioxygenase-like ring-hydroxylating dioxygenase large terminal subunit
LGGRLIGAPLMDELPGFDKADYPLHPAALVEWEGFLYINLARQPAAKGQPAPFEAAFAPLLGKFDEWNLPGLQMAARIEYDVKANWKLIVQNYSECYHCPLIHPNLAHISPYRSGRNDLYEGPFLGGYMDLRHEYGSMTMSGRACAAPLGGLSGEDVQRVYYYSLFPNVLLSLHPDYVMCHTLWPEGPGQTHINCEWLFDPQAMAQPGFDAADAVKFWDMTNRQDWRWLACLRPLSLFRAGELAGGLRSPGAQDAGRAARASARLEDRVRFILLQTTKPLDHECTKDTKGTK